MYEIVDSNSNSTNLVYFVPTIKYNDLYVHNFHERLFL